MAKLIGVLADKPHIAHVAVLVREQRVDGVRVDRTVEVPVRKEIWDALKTAAKQEAYAQECAEYHSAQGPGWQAKRNARRKIWDDDDKVKADAKAAKEKVVEEARLAALRAETDAKAEAERLAKEAAEAAAKAEREEKFLFDVTDVVADKEGGKLLQATVQYHGRSTSFTAPYTEDKAVLEASLREAFATWETEQLARETFLASMSQTA